MIYKLEADNDGNGKRYTTKGTWILKSLFGGEVGVKIICFEHLGAGICYNSQA